MAGEVAESAGAVDLGLVLIGSRHAVSVAGRHVLGSGEKAAAKLLTARRWRRI